MTYRLAIVPRALVVVDAFGGVGTQALELRRACVEAVTSVCEGATDVGLVVGERELRRSTAPGTAGTLLPFGVDIVVGGGSSLAELLGRWLIATVCGEPSPSVEVFATVSQARAAGLESLLVLADGAFGLSDSSPTGAIAGAEDSDRVCRRIAGGADALATAEVEDLSLPAPGEDCVALWRELAAIGGNTAAGSRGVGGGVVKRVYYGDAPFGIGYHVASWLVGEDRETKNG
nr:hypothetical protein [Corynebacterium lactis]